MEPTIYKRSPEAKNEEHQVLVLRFKDRSVQLTRKFMIGRDSHHEIPLIHDPLVSRNHAMINFVRGVYYLHDMNSLNGTYINQRPLAKGERVALALGDCIVVGKTTITVHAGIS